MKHPNAKRHVMLDGRKLGIRIVDGVSPL
jgi:hypothetical protein